MKKNKFLKLASGLLMLVLITCCAVSGTFAKYVTDGSANDSARVAKWGMDISIDASKDFAPNMKDEVGDGLAQVEASDGLTNKVAPGTRGTMFEASITGQPEVAFNVAITFELTLNDWSVNSAEYCPIVFTVGTETYSLTGMGGTHESATIAELKTAVQNAVITALQADSSEDYEANDEEFKTGKTVTLSWAWAFETGADAIAKEANSEKDTALGNNTTLATIGYNFAIVITQLD